MSPPWMLCGEDIFATKYNGGRHVEVHGPVERLQEGEDDREGDLRGVVDLPQVLCRVLVKVHLLDGAEPPIEKPLERVEQEAVCAVGAPQEKVALLIPLAFFVNVLVVLVVVFLLLLS